MLGFPTKAVPNHNDLEQDDATAMKVRADLRVPVFSARAGFIPMPVDFSRCTQSSAAEVPPPSTTVCPTDPFLACKTIYPKPNGAFPEFIGAMMMMFSDSSYADDRGASAIYEDVMKPLNTRAFQKAVVQAYISLRESYIGGMPMAAICGGCVMDRSDSRKDETHCQFALQKMEGETITGPYHNTGCRFTYKPAVAVPQPTGPNAPFSPCPLLSTSASLPSDGVSLEHVLDGMDKDWRNTDAARRFVLVLDNCPFVDCRS